MGNGGGDAGAGGPASAASSAGERPAETAVGRGLYLYIRLLWGFVGWRRVAEEFGPFVDPGEDFGAGDGDGFQLGAEAGVLGWCGAGAFLGRGRVRVGVRVGGGIDGADGGYDGVAEAAGAGAGAADEAAGGGDFGRQVVGIVVMGHKSAAVVGVLQPPDVRFLHLEQGLHNRRAPTGILHQGGQDGRHNLPGNAELILQPAALHGFAAF